MSIALVREYLKKYGAETRIREFSESTATVAEAAKALNTDADRIAKTLSFAQKDKAVVIVVSGNSKVDNRKYKNVFSVKAKMLGADEVEKLTNHPVGGVCPFALPENTDVYLDISLKKHATVFPACGTANSAIELTNEELEKISGSKGWVDIASEG